MLSAVIKVIPLSNLQDPIKTRRACLRFHMMCIVFDASRSYVTLVWTVLLRYPRMYCLLLNTTDSFFYRYSLSTMQLNYHHYYYSEVDLIVIPLTAELVVKANTQAVAGVPFM